MVLRRHCGGKICNINDIGQNQVLRPPSKDAHVILSIISGVEEGITWHYLVIYLLLITVTNLFARMFVVSI